MSYAYPHLILVHGERHVADAVNAAAELGYAQWQFSHVSSVDEAERHQPSEAELLILLDGSEEERRHAREVMLSDGLPRWGVVLLTEGTGLAQSIDEIPASEWHPAPLARHLRHALSELALRRRCLRHEGDMLTIARRIRHDLNAPLNGIMSVTELIQDLSTDGSSEGEVRSLAATVFESVDMMVNLINRVSLVARSSASPPERVEVRMEEPLAAALQKLESAILKEKATLLAISPMPVVRGVAAWLQVIWETLIHNALKHGGNPPKIGIGWADNSDGLKFWVEDNGSGVDEQLRVHLFKPFHRLHEDNRAHGLGLSLVQRLVSLMEGQCGAEMVEGGFRFYFVLPKDLLGRNG